MSIITEKIAQLTEEEASSITSSTILDNLDAWDSLAKVSFLVFASTEFGVQLDGRDLEKAETVGALQELLSGKQKDGN